MSNWLYEWNDKYISTLSLIVSKKSEMAVVSGSENASGPAYVSLHGSDEAPPSVYAQKIMKIILKLSKKYFTYASMNT